MSFLSAAEPPNQCTDLPRSRGPSSRAFSKAACKLYDDNDCLAAKSASPSGSASRNAAQSTSSPASRHASRKAGITISQPAHTAAISLVVLRNSSAMTWVTFGDHSSATRAPSTFFNAPRIALSKTMPVVAKQTCCPLGRHDFACFGFLGAAWACRALPLAGQGALGHGQGLGGDCLPVRRRRFGGSGKSSTMMTALLRFAGLLAGVARARLAGFSIAVQSSIAVAGLVSGGAASGPLDTRGPRPGRFGGGGGSMAPLPPSSTTGFGGLASLVEKPSSP
mmetsp:Transcript_38653/g.86467  ORF Transcript_38653/g.86467 Transcript_38653/m.86467 type:complete len:279 (+) Transcript_38653:293-1129(+)